MTQLIEIKGPTTVRHGFGTQVVCPFANEPLDCILM